MTDGHTLRLSKSRPFRAFRCRRSARRPRWRKSSRRRSTTGVWRKRTSSCTWAAPAAEIEAYRSAPTPNVIFLEATAKREELIQYLTALSEFCDAGTKVVVTGRMNDIVLYRDLMARGVSEYLVAPFSVLDFIRAISRLYTSHGADLRQSRGLCGPKAASAPRHSRIMSPGGSHANSKSRPPLPISILASAPPG